MSCDLEGSVPVFRPVAAAHPTDLEAIVMLLELAAISLTKGPESTFTATELIEEARRIGGDECPLDERDARIVLVYVKFLQRVGAGRLRLR